MNNARSHVNAAEPGLKAIAERDLKLKTERRAGTRTTHPKGDPRSEEPRFVAAGLATGNVA